MYYNASAEWLTPFINSVKDLVPLDKLDAIKGYKIKRNYEPGQYGACIKTIATNRYVITLKMKDWSKQDKKYKNATIGGILETLAHELAHLSYWEHTHEHWKLQSRIQLRFSNVIKKLDVLTDSRWKDDL
jgi:hypothetical protein